MGQCLSDPSPEPPPPLPPPPPRTQPAASSRPPGSGRSAAARAVPEQHRRSGIDLGTSNSRVAVWRNGRMEVIPNDQGEPATPSCLAFTASGRLVGAAAAAQTARNAGGTVWGAKRLLGLSGSDPAVETEAQRWLLKLEAGPGNRPLIRVAGAAEPQALRPEQAAAALLSSLRRSADAHLARADAALGSCSTPPGQVKAVAGSSRLGRADFDARLALEVRQAFEASHGQQLGGDARAMRRLLAAAEQARRQLSSAVSATLEVESLRGGIDLRCTVTRGQFNELSGDLFERCARCVDQVLESIGDSDAPVEEVLLLGGASRMPRLQEVLRQRTGGRAPVRRAFSADDGPVRGAAYQGAILGGLVGERGPLANVLLLDVAPRSLGCEGASGAMLPLIPRNTTIPDKATTQEPVQLGASQGRLMAQIWEGEDSVASQNTLLGRYASREAVLPGMYRLHLGIDANGELEVKAIDPATGAEHRLVAQPSPRHLPRDELERMAGEEARLLAEEARLRRLVVELSVASPSAQQAAAEALARLAGEHPGKQAAIAAAGAIPPLVALLGHASGGVQEAAARALHSLAAGSLVIQAEVEDCGGVSALLGLLLDSHNARVRGAAERALGALGVPVDHSAADFTQPAAAPATSVPAAASPPPFLRSLSSNTRECRVCLEEHRLFELLVLVPCGHNPACARCTQELLRMRRPCPICRHMITRSLKVYNC